MSLTIIAIWIIVGVITGLLINGFLSGMWIGRAGAILIGIFGAILGGLIFDLLDVRTLTGLWGIVLESFLGAAFLLSIFSLIRRS